MTDFLTLNSIEFTVEARLKALAVELAGHGIPVWFDVYVEDDTVFADVIVGDEADVKKGAQNEQQK